MEIGNFIFCIRSTEVYTSGMAPSIDRPLTLDEVARISAEHLIKTVLKPADLLFIFGTREGVRERVDAACDIWRKGYCRWVLISGGATLGLPVTECQVIADALVSRGVPSSLIIEEHEATNTGENVIFSLPLIDARVGLKNIRNVICLGNFWTGRRYAMTLHRHWPEVEKMLVTVNHYKTPTELWHTDPALRARVLTEWDKIEPYKVRGFIAEWP
jgi:uncharacterized SAM-binding protein YcdF (DUF218 family)